VPIGHFAPYDLSEEVIEDAKHQLTLAAQAMGLDNCAINADFILKDGKTYVLELGGRSGATCLAELVSIYYGYDYYEKLIRAALGEEVDFPQTKAVPNASKLLRSDRDGVIRSITNRNEPQDGIYEIQFDYGVGDQVRKFHVGPHRIGHVITKGETLEEAVALLQDALSKIEIVVE
jgi:biotin carboxylase